MSLLPGATGGGFATVREAQEPPHLLLLAVGDVNLGRAVGQRILRGDTLFPFLAVRDTLARYDIVFANLESPLSDQDGETESPGNNLVFTGPPAGAESLRRGGITVVSTANNHALDYGVAGCRETRHWLDEAGVLHAGTADDVSGTYTPVLMKCKGIRVALFACTDVMNGRGRAWKKFVAAADTGILLPSLRRFRDSVDFMIVSYHGGTEYANRPAKRTEEFALAAMRAGADLVLGHHPHVSYGLEESHGRLAVASLGNFVFRQPSKYWTQRSFALEAEIVKDSAGASIRRYRCLPVLSGFQPNFVPGGKDAEAIRRRIALLSQPGVREHSTW